MSPAQIDIGVAKSIGQTGRAWGSAMEALGNAFGSLATAVQTAGDDQALADAKLEQTKAYDGLFDETVKATTDEDPSPWQAFPGAADNIDKEVDAKYGPRMSPKAQREFQQWRAQRGYQYRKTGLQYGEAAAVKTYDLNLSKTETELESRISDPNNTNVGQTLEDAVDIMRSRIFTENNARGYSEQMKLDRERAMLTRFMGAAWSKLSAEQRSSLQEQIENARVKDVGLNRTSDSSREPGGPVKIYDDNRVPSPAERAAIRRTGGIVINLDTNHAPRDRQTTPMVVIPDNATPQQREAAMNYAREIAAVYRQQFGNSIEPKVVTRSQNGRGRSDTIHTEPFSVNDTKAADFFTSEQGRRLHADIIGRTLGKIPGAVFSLPHDQQGKGDTGAVGPRGSEVQLAKILVKELRGLGLSNQQATQVAAAVQNASPEERQAVLNRVSEEGGGGSDDAIGQLLSGPTLVRGPAEDAGGDEAPADGAPQLTQAPQLVRGPAEAEPAPGAGSTEDPTGNIAPAPGAGQTEAPADQAKPRRAANDNFAKFIAGKGELEPGQVFEIQTGTGKFRIRSEDLNKVDRKALKKIWKETEERFAVERQRETLESQNMMKEHVDAIKRGYSGVDGYNPEQLKRVMERTPAGRRAWFEHEKRVKFWQSVNDVTTDLYDLPDAAIEERIANIKTDEDLTPKEIDTALSRVEKARALRTSDPVRAALNSQALRPKIAEILKKPEGVARDAELYQTILSHQKEISPEREPRVLTRTQAKELHDKVMPYFSTGNAEEKFTALYKQYAKNYGPEVAKIMMRDMMDMTRFNSDQKARIEDSISLAERPTNDPGKQSAQRRTLYNISGQQERLKTIETLADEIRYRLNDPETPKVAGKKVNPPDAEEISTFVKSYNESKPDKQKQLARIWDETYNGGRPGGAQRIVDSVNWIDQMNRPGLVTRWLYGLDKDGKKAAP